jgi:hypothetical protein
VESAVAWIETIALAEPQGELAEIRVLDLTDRHPS